MKPILWLALMVLGATSCGSTDDSPSSTTQTYFCDYPASSSGGAGQHWCWGWSETVNKSIDATLGWKQACSSGGGSAVSSCPTSGAIGKCTIAVAAGNSTVSETLYLYTGTIANGSQFCSFMNQPASGTTASWTAL